ncbi:hypothetical protein C5F48_00340 [Cereibacter changlensis JA139]|jgi:hypothetical protein|uniref:Uncharacterized protein n=2 Tax=Cereibacter changlensis TaxID=402884 RepID=A0A2T4K0R3_9RHOB|nr:hypothetical protein [Cereibacter sp.]PTE23740.1 hypothetical protein C5F48_00340 [Cereibacter changlensis JA139]
MCYPELFPHYGGREQIYLWGIIMLRTITIGTCVQVQGLLVGHLADGKIMVRVDERNFVGFPVSTLRAA